MTSMKRNDLTAAVAAETGQSQAAVDGVLDALFVTLAKSASEGVELTVPGQLAAEAKSSRRAKRYRTLPKDAVVRSPGETSRNGLNESFDLVIRNDTLNILSKGFKVGDKLLAGRNEKFVVVDQPRVTKGVVGPTGASRRVKVVVDGHPKLELDRQEAVVNDIAAAVRSLLLDRVHRGENFTNIGDIDVVAEQVIERLPIAASPWPQIVGPCYSSGSLQKELDISRAAVSKAVSDLRLLRLETADGTHVYPAFQITHRSMVRGMREVLIALREGVNDPWTWAQWLNTPVPDLSSDDSIQTSDLPKRPHISRLIEGDVDAVVRAAHRTAAGWAA